MTVSPFPAAPDPADFLTVAAVAEAEPMPDALREQIGNWIEPATMRHETDHADAMTCVAVAYPLIKAHVLASAERERLVHENPALAAQIRQGIEEAERGETVDRGSFAQHLDEDEG